MKFLQKKKAHTLVARVFAQNFSEYC